MFEKIGIIGTGNMGSAVAEAIVKSLCEDKGAGGAELYLANRRTQKAQALAEKLAERIVSCAEPGNRPQLFVATNTALADACDLIVLAVKPQVLPGVMAELSGILAERAAAGKHFVLVTMAAGVSCAALQAMAGGSYPVIRIMPNTPASIGKGVVEYCSADAAEEEQLAFVRLLKPAGLVDPIEERLIDAASAVTGCGPAYVYMFISAMADAGVKCGLPRDKAIAYAAATVEGSAAMVLASGQHPEQLKDAVCSPGGTTICGVEALEEHAFRAAVMSGVCAAYEKTAAMAKGAK